MKYGAAIRVLRAAANLSKKQLAEKAGYDASYITLLEQDQREPSQEALRRIAEVLGCDWRALNTLADRCVCSDCADLVGSTVIALISGEQKRHASTAERDMITSPRATTKEPARRKARSHSA